MAKKIDVEEIERKTKKEPYEIQYGKKYLITERPNTGTPSALKELGRSKMGGDFVEYIGCPWIESQQRYDTGLNRYSPEFIGKTEQYISLKLKERKPLIDYFEQLLTTSRKDETVFIGGDGENVKPFRLAIFHNAIIDTSNIENYLKLFFAMRSNLIMPPNEKGNIGKYSAAMYQLNSVEEQAQAKGKKAIMQGEVVQWFMANYDVNKVKVEDYLIYTSILPVGQTKTKGVLLEFVMMATDDFETLERLHNAITNISHDEVKLHVKILQKIKNGVLKREKGVITYQGEKMGTTVAEVVRKLQQSDYIEVAEKLFN